MSSRALTTPLDERPTSPRAVVPPLENGAHLSREEFYRRWNAMAELNRAERLGGVVFMEAAVPFREHGNPHAHVVTWLGNYEAATPGVGVADNTTLEFRTDGV